MNTLQQILIIAAAMLVSGAIGAAFGNYKGRAVAGFWFGFFLGVIGWILVIVGPDQSVKFKKPDPRSVPISPNDPDIQAHLARKAQHGE